MPAPEHQLPDYALRQIYFYLTGGCNLRCRHCWVLPEKINPQRADAFLDVDLFANILEQAKPLGLNSVKLTGGEPFLHPQIARLLDTVKAADLRLVMESNGVLLTPELAAAVASCRNPYVSVSLDGAEAETHEWVRGVPGCYQGALRGISYLVQAGVRPQVIFSLMRRNRDEVEAIVHLAQKLGAESVKFNILMAAPRTERMQEDEELLTLTELLDLGRWVERELSPRVNIPIIFHYPPAFRMLSQLFADNGKGAGTCGIQGIIGVLPDGSYALCGIGGYIPELVFGHAARDPLANVWHDHPVLCDIRAGLPDKLTGICSECLVRSRCLGFCLAQNYYRSRDLWAPYWFCQEADAAGLFPASRKRSNMVKSNQKPGEPQEKLALRA